MNFPCVTSVNSPNHITLDISGTEIAYKLVTMFKCILQRFLFLVLFAVNVTEGLSLHALGQAILFAEEDPGKVAVGKKIFEDY